MTTARVYRKSRGFLSEIVDEELTVSFSASGILSVRGKKGLVVLVASVFLLLPEVASAAACYGVPAGRVIICIKEICSCRVGTSTRNRLAPHTCL